MTNPLIAKIAVPVPLYGLFDYIVPPEYANSIQKGCRVRVPFGRKPMVGMVVALGSESEFPVAKLKSITENLDTHAQTGPALTDEVLKLLEWAATYYQHPLGEVLFSALPRYMRQGELAELKSEKVWRLSESGAQYDASTLKRSAKQAALLTYMQQSPLAEHSAAQLNEAWDNWRTAIKALVDKQLLTMEEKPVSALISARHSAAELKLNAEQAVATDAVVACLSEYKTFLLQGITGSGKTEVYLSIIEKALAQNTQVLVLVPEISLTPQLTQRFVARLDVEIASLHSGLNDTQRHSAWVKASQGIARVVIGTRSALFTPMPQLGLIIIDEEHDASFKQQEGFRYHARDLALVRAKNKNIPVLLGSATPSFESLENVSRGQYELLKLTQRGAKNAQPPKVSLLDVCKRPMEDGISDRLLDKVQEHINKQGQVLLFLNRRGYAPLLMCHECGWTTACTRCDANMTLHHHNQMLRCHHCGYEKPAPKVCPECQHESLYIPGAGTERIENALTEKFPDAVISRIDRDTTRRKGELDKKLKEAREGAAQILIGTQMLAKGHDFPNLTLVGILDVDQGLFSADFRGTEHMAQLVVQVSGRAGRSEKRGEVILQTHHPEHPLLHTLLETGYSGFAEHALKERREAFFPPFSFMAILRCESTHKDQGKEFLNECRQAFNYKDVDAFGPLPAPMERRAGRYRWQLIIMAKQRKLLHGALRDWMPRVIKFKSASKVRWSIDVDPQDMF